MRRAEALAMSDADPTASLLQPAARHGRAGVRLAVIRNFVWLSADKAIAVVVGLVVFGLIARRYGPVGSGHFAYASALLQTTLGLSFICGAPAVLPRLCRLREGIGSAVANIWAVRMFGALVATVGVAIFALTTIEDRDRLVVSLIMVGTAPLIEPFYIAVTYWQSCNHNRAPVLIRSVGLLVRGTWVALAIVFGAPVWAVALAWLAETLVAATLQTRSLRTLAPLKRLARSITRTRALAYLRFGVRFQPGLLLTHVFLRTDRLVLAEHLSPRDFGIYATAMQLVEVWLQIATIVGVSIGPAFLYRAIAEGRPWQWYARVGAAIAAIGMAGVAATAVFGRFALRIVFGPTFESAAPYLVAGMVFAGLFFVDQAIEMSLTASNRPRALATKWMLAGITALLVMFAFVDRLGAYVGPMALSIGLLTGWAYVALDARHRRTNGRLKVVKPAIEG